jgi:hypothetical protein
MRSIVRQFTCLVWSLCGVVLVIPAAGCGGGGNSIITALPIAVSLPVSTVVVPQDGTQVIVPILITSTSETALVSVRGLPAGVQVKYSASDTNPSGSLALTGSAETPNGAYSVTVTVNSAGQTASTNFTLVIAQSGMGSISGQKNSATPRGRGRVKSTG